MEHLHQQTQQARKQKLPKRNQVWTAMCNVINLARWPTYSYSLTTRVFIVKHKMELTLKSGQRLQPFLPTPLWEGPETDAMTFGLIFISYAGSQEGATGRSSSSHEHILRWETLPRVLPPARLLNLVLLGNRKWRWNGIAENDIQWGPERILGGRGGKKEKKTK